MYQLKRNIDYSQEEEKEIIKNLDNYNLRKSFLVKKLAFDTRIQDLLI